MAMSAKAPFRVQFSLRASRQPGFASILARVCINSERSDRFATGLVVETASWCSNKARSSTTPSVNSSIIEIDDVLTGIYREGKRAAEVLTPDEIRIKFIERQSVCQAPKAAKMNFIEVLDKFRAFEAARSELEQSSINTYGRYIDKYLKPTALLLKMDSLDATKVTRVHIDSILIKLKMNTHPEIKTISFQGKVHGYLRTCCVWAFSYGLFKVDPMAGVKIPRGGSEPFGLTHGQQDAIRRLPLVESSLVEVRDMYLFQIDTGLNFEDSRLVNKENLTWEDGLAWLRIVRDKSKEGQGQKLIADVCLTKEAYRIAEKYDWKINSRSNQDTNRSLKVIGLVAGIKEPLKNKHARTTFSQNLMDLGLDRYMIKAVMGHKVGDTLEKHYARPSRRRIGRELIELGYVSPTAFV
jgi:site-specific recombinase XerD